MLAPKVIASGGGSVAYNSHPNPLFDKDGGLVVAYYRGGSHAYDNHGRVCAKISADGGETFGPEILICDHPSGYDTRNIALAYDPASHVHTAFFRTFDAGISIAAGVHKNLYYCQSADGGQTWGAPVDISGAVTGYGVDFVVPFGVAVLTSNGLMQLFVGRNSATSQTIAWALFSTDGVNWGNLTEVYKHTGTALPTEPYPVRIDDDRVVVMIRNYANGYEASFACVKSSDGGATWSGLGGAFGNWSTSLPAVSSPICGYRTSPTEVVCAWGSRGEADGRGYIHLQRVGVEAFFSRPQLGFLPSEPRQKFYISKVDNSNGAHWSEFSYPQIFGDNDGNNFIAWYDSHDGSDRVSTDCWMSSLS